MGHAENRRNAEKEIRRKKPAAKGAAVLLAVCLCALPVIGSRDVFSVENQISCIRVVFLGQVFQIEKSPIEKTAEIYRSLIKKAAVFLPYTAGGERILAQQ